MRINVPGRLIRGVAALFSLYLVVLGIATLDRPADRVAVIIALVLYSLATTISLLPLGRSRMPIWMAAFNAAVVIVISLAVTANLQPNPVGGNGYATWYVGAAGALMTITATRGRPGFAWAGSAALVLLTLAWAGPGALVAIGVVALMAPSLIKSPLGAAQRQASSSRADLSRRSQKAKGGGVRSRPS